MREIVLAALAFLWAFSVDTRIDAEGNVYPQECQRDLAKDTALMERVMIRSIPMDKRIKGITHPMLANGKALIILNSRYGGWIETDTTQHELCHALLLLSGRDPRWHK